MTKRDRGEGGGQNWPKIALRTLWTAPKCLALMQSTQLGPTNARMPRVYDLKPVLYVAALR